MGKWYWTDLVPIIYVVLTVIGYSSLLLVSWVNCHLKRIQNFEIIQIIKSRFMIKVNIIGSKSLTKYCENCFLTPTLLHRLIWSKMSFSNFSSSTRWLFQIFFQKSQNDVSYFKVPYNQ